MMHELIAGPITVAASRRLAHSALPGAPVVAVRPRHRRLRRRAVAESRRLAERP